MAKQKPFIIRTPFLTLEEVRKEKGLSKKDAKQVDEILKNIWRKEARRKKKKSKRKIKK